MRDAWKAASTQGGMAHRGLGVGVFVGCRVKNHAFGNQSLEAAGEVGSKPRDIIRPHLINDDYQCGSGTICLRLLCSSCISGE